MPEHSEAFQRALVDEALNRTPTGGFPELERRHGLKAGVLFDWVERFGQDAPPAPFAALHVWVGTTDLDEHEFSAYFDNDPSYWDLDEHELEAAPQDVTGCGFSIDLGERHLYDEDLLQVIWRPHAVAVRDLLAEAAMHSDETAEAIARACEARGIHEANAAFVYADPSQEVRAPEKAYNGLSYLGLYRD